MPWCSPSDVRKGAKEVTGFALGCIALALILGYAISSSLIGPVMEIESN
jgi:hypothetical protein